MEYCVNKTLHDIIQMENKGWDETMKLINIYGISDGMKYLPKLILNVTKGERPESTDDILMHYQDLIRKCWSQSPSEIPSFDSIVDELKNNRSFISDSVDEITYYDFIEYFLSFSSRIFHFF